MRARQWIRLAIATAIVATVGTLWPAQEAVACPPDAPETCIGDAGIIRHGKCFMAGCFSEEEFCCWIVT
jgi:hypothetical protein